MTLGAQILIGIIAIEHIFIAWLEIFVWTTLGAKFFPQMTSDFLQKTKVLAANQGLYNGFLAAGLIWAIFIGDPTWSLYVAQFFLGCVIIAGLFGSMTSSKAILYKQSLPAVLVLLAIQFIL